MDQSTYFTWETNAYSRFAELRGKYMLVKRKIDDIGMVQKPKHSKKEQLLEMKAKNTISKEGDLDLILIESEEYAEVIKEKLLHQAQKKYDELVEFANTQYSG